ncbi:UBX domain-containing protein 11 isoform X2 [Exaiptasia diaphana]|uniref:UBX domain-containing protein 11 n=1 Tax=Exaiptasia diaphana TaxID=2652724 RepID=A0A913XK44_EXADI|nr:UBX domain-containing protein 11 isoform X2 [Exaiptasia diaphana]KXJ06139.1 UBX domain-containing protein 11 [Exaiptasia diaphana]
MSSPISSLKKGKRNPLNPRQPRAPFRYDAGLDEPTSEMLDDIPSDFLRRDIISKLPKSSHKGTSSVPNDHDLLTSMAGRLSQTEAELRVTKKELIDKDRNIKILQEKVQLLEKARGYNSDTIGDLEQKCHSLQTQVHEMEEFLADYGLVWVGNQYIENEYQPLDDDEGPVSDQDIVSKSGMWNPVASVPQDTLQINFDLLIKNIKELNILSGEGCAVVSKTKDGARLKVPDPVPLTLFSNGIFMFGGPFRPYTDPTTQQCIQDIMDGYFPSELQSRFPDGVPFDVSDKREIAYQDRRTEILFPGEGQSLLKDSPDDRETGKVTSEVPGPKSSVENFLSRLPQSVVKAGKIIDVRSGIEQTIKGSDGQPSSVVVVNTPALNDIKTRAEENDKSKERPKTGTTKVTTLRIKSETGEKTYLVKMSFTDTIADLREHLNAVRPKGAPDYNIKSSFPNKVYSDLSATLVECGLVPNATLHLLIKKA